MGAKNIALVARRLRDPLSAGRQSGTLVDSDPHVTRGVRQLPRGDHRAHLRCRIGRIPNDDPAGAFNEPFHEAVVDRAFHKYARTLHAGLSAGHEGGEEGAAYSFL